MNNTSQRDTTQLNKKGSLIGRLASRVIAILMFLICAYLTVASMFTTVRLSSTEHIYFTADNPILHIAVIMLFFVGSGTCVRPRCLTPDNAATSAPDPGVRPPRLTRPTTIAFYIAWGLFTVLMFGIVISARLVPTFDQLHVSEVAMQILHNDYSAFLKGGYARLWDNQSGFIMFLSFIFGIFGDNNFVAFQIINVICYSATVLLIRALAKRCELWGSGTGVRPPCLTPDIIGIAACLFMPMWFFTTFVYGTAPALALSLAAMILEYDFYQDDARKVWKMVAASILIAAAIVLKTNALIYMLAMLAYAVIKTFDIAADYRRTVAPANKLSIFDAEEPIDTLAEIDTADETTEPSNATADSTQPIPSYDEILDAAAEHYEKIKDVDRFVPLRCVAGVLLILIMYVVSSKGMSIAMTNITGMSELSGTPRTAHIAMGLQESSNKSSGWFNGYNESVYVDNGYDHDAANDAAIVNIKMSIGKFKSNPSYAVGFFLKKIVSQWCEPTYESMFVMMSRRTQAKSIAPWLHIVTKAGFGSEVLGAYMNIFQTLLYFGAMLYFAMTIGVKTDVTTKTDATTKANARTNPDDITNTSVADSAALVTNNHAINRLLPAIVVIGGFLFHLMWEANSQYILVYAILLIGYSVDGYRMCAEKLAKADAILLSRAGKTTANVSKASTWHWGQTPVPDPNPTWHRGQTPVPDPNPISDPTPIFVVAAVLILAAVAVVPDESFIGRAFKMNWNTQEYLETRAHDIAADGDWTTRLCEEGTMEIERHGALIARNNKGTAIKNGRYVLRPLIDQDHMLVVADSGMEYGDKIVIDQANENRVIVHCEKDGYVLRFQNSQLVMDIDRALDVPGTGAQQWGYNGDVSQVYDIVSNDDGTYTIIYRSNMALTTDGDGQVYVDMLDGGDDQKWIFEKVK